MTQFETPLICYFLLAQVDKTMCEFFHHQGLFRSILKSAPTFLRRADPRIRDEILAKLTGNRETTWSAETTLDSDTYTIWLQYMTVDVHQRYKISSNISNPSSNKPTLPKSVQITKRLIVLGKLYSSNTLRRGQGNSMIEYYFQAKPHFGKIDYAFVSEVVPTAFLVVRQFATLNAKDSTRNCYSSHPHLHADIVYSRIEQSVVIDICDLIGHIVVMSNPPAYLGIEEETLLIVSLRNIVSVCQFGISQSPRTLILMNQSGIISDSKVDQ